MPEKNDDHFGLVEKILSGIDDCDNLVEKILSGNDDYDNLVEEIPSGCNLNFIIEMLGKLAQEKIHNIYNREKVEKYLAESGRMDLLDFLVGEKPKSPLENNIWYITTYTRKYVCLGKGTLGNNTSEETYYEEFLNMIETFNIPEEYFFKVCEDGQKRAFFNSMQHAPYARFVLEKWESKDNVGEDLYSLYKQMMHRWKIIQKNKGIKAKVSLSDYLMIQNILTRLLCPFELDPVDIRILDPERIRLKGEKVYQGQIRDIKEKVAQYFFKSRETDMQHRNLLEEFALGICESYNEKWIAIQRGILDTADSPEAKQCLLAGIIEIEKRAGIYLQYAIRSFLEEYKMQKTKIEKQDSATRFSSYDNLWDEERLLCSQAFYHRMLGFDDKDYIDCINRRPKGMTILELWDYYPSKKNKNNTKSDD